MDILFFFCNSVKMLNFICVSLLTVVFLLLYKNLTKNHDYWKKKKVAYKKPLLLFGNMKDFFLLRHRYIKVISDIYESFPEEKIVGFFVGPRPELLIRDPELIKLILVKDFQYFFDRFDEVDCDKEPMLGHLINLSGQRWKNLRQKLTPTFSSGKIKNMFPLLLEKGDQLEQHVRASLKKGANPEIRDLMARFTTEVIGSCAFGIQMNSLNDDHDPFRLMGRKLFEPTFSNAIKRMLRNAVPQLFYFLGQKSFDFESLNYFKNIFYSILNDRRKNKTKRKDFIDILMELKNGDVSFKNEDDIELTDEVLLAQAFIFFIAGFETSSTTLSFALHELALNKSIQENVRNEITNMIEKYNGVLTYEAVAEMPYMDMIISEALRKYSVVGFLARICKKDYLIPGTNVVIEKDTKIKISLQSLHMDPKYFPEPHIFDPERFSPDMKNKRHPFAFVPFGEGPRVCIAERFGRLQTKIGLIKMIQNFHLDFEGDEGEILMETKSTFPMSVNGLFLKITPLQENW